MEEAKVNQVEELYDKSVSCRSIAKEVGISRSSVDRIISDLKKRRAEQNGPSKQTAVQTTSEERMREIIREEMEQREDHFKLPTVLKTAKGQEAITPEGIMQSYLMVEGDHGAAMLQGMMLLRAAQLMVMNDVEIMKGQAEAQATAIKPVLDIMEKAREDMDAAAERSRASSQETAEAAAAGAAARAVAHMDERFRELKEQKTDIATTKDPMRGLMARNMETLFNRLTGQVMGVPPGPTPGLIDERQQSAQQQAGGK